MTAPQKPLPAYLQDFLNWIDIEKGLSSKTQENYTRFLKKFFAWLNQNNLSHLKPRQLSPDHIWRYRVYLSRGSKKPLARSTQNYYLIALRQFLNFLANKDITTLPSEKVKLARNKQERKVHFLTLDQLKKLLTSPDITTRKGLRDRALLETFFSTGMRVSELRGLNCDQIKIKGNTADLELGIIGKGGRARTVYFSERALKWLKRYLKARDDKAKPLFINYRGPKNASRRLTATGIYKIIKSYAIGAGLPPNTSPHTLRHTFATDLLAQGVDIRTLQEFLGHKDITATQIYAHVTSKQLSQAHKKYHSGRKLKE